MSRTKITQIEEDYVVILTSPPKTVICKKELPMPQQPNKIHRIVPPLPKLETKLPTPKDRVRLMTLPKERIILKQVVQKFITLPKNQVQKNLRPITLPKQTNEARKILRPITLPKPEELKALRVVSKQEVKEPEERKALRAITLPKPEELKALRVVPKQEVKEPEERKALRAVTFFKEPEPINTVPLHTLTYNIPTRSDLAVLLVFFDYIGSVRILMNYLFMREKLKLANIPVFTLELVMTDSKPKISDAIHVYGSSYLFQKENLIRLLEKHIPNQFTKIACLDADLLFDDPQWYDKLSVMLDKYQIVQCFENATWLDITYTKVEKTAKSIITYNPSYKTSFYNSPIKYHPGFGWAFTRDWYNKTGFYDLAIIGSGDSILSHALFNFAKYDKLNLEFRLYTTVKDWWNSTDHKIAYLPVNLYHLYHGPLANRQYYSRYKHFNEYSDIREISKQNDDGVYELTFPHLNNIMKEYFKSRDDDGN